jgi:chromosome segregation ATPase
MRYFLLFLLVSLQAGWSWAAAPRGDGDSSQAAKAQYLLRQISAERDAARAENAKLQAEIEELQEKLDKAESRQTRLEKSLDSTGDVLDKYKENSEKLRERILKDRERTLELVEKFKDTIKVLRTIEHDKSTLQASLDQREQRLQECEAKNLKMYQANLDLLDQYENKGAWDALMQKEPVTGLKRVEVENIVENYKNLLNRSSFANAQ